jgi:uncharacterized protein (TIGR03437 family)
MLALSGALAPAQISGLATTADGSKVYFVTSLRQTGSTQSTTSKVFVLANGVLTLVAQGPAFVSVPGGPPWIYNRPSLSGDGSILAINGPSPCLPSWLCTTTIEGQGATLQIDGNASLSPNGRFAAVYGNYDQVAPNSLRLVDFARGTVTVLGPQPAVEGQFVTDQGAWLVGHNNGVRVRGPKGDVDLVPSAPMFRALLAPDASRIVYGDLYQIHVLDVASGIDRSLFSGSMPMLANDGRTIAYLDGKAGSLQAWLADAVSGATRQLTAEHDGLIDLAIAGDGSQVFAVTSLGRVIAVRIATGAVTELLGSPGPAASLSYFAVPGSYNEVRGDFPADYEPDVRVNGIRAPILNRQPGRIEIQIPWEANPDPLGQVVLRSSDPAWADQLLRGGVLALDGIFLSDAFHQDWSGAVTASAPARPGEVIHIYGTGGGAVDGMVADGKPTPVDRLYRMTTLCDWRINSYVVSQAADVPFAGLAPGLVGLYQVDLRIPENWTFPMFSAICYTPQSSSFPTPVVPVQR